MGIGFQSPYQRYNQSDKHKLDHFLTFGSRVQYFIHSEKRESKMSPRSASGVYLGSNYDPLYNLISHIVDSTEQHKMVLTKTISIQEGDYLTPQEWQALGYTELDYFPIDPDYQPENANENTQDCPVSKDVSVESIDNIHPEQSSPDSDTLVLQSQRPRRSSSRIQEIDSATNNDAEIARLLQDDVFLESLLLATDDELKEALNDIQLVGGNV